MASKNQSKFKIRITSQTIDLLLGIAIIVVIIASVTLINKKQPSSSITTVVSISPPFSTPSPLPNIPTQLSIPNHKILYARDHELWMYDLGTKQSTRIVVLPDSINAIVPSQDGTKAAVTYLDSNERPANFGFPKTGLSIVDLPTYQATELIPRNNTIVRYPTWSSDGSSISVWIDDGKSANIYNTQNYHVVFSIQESTNEKPVSPIVFLKNNDIAFVQDNTLYESSLSGQNKRSIVSTVNIIRQVHEGPDLPDPTIYSPDGNYFTYHNQKEQLMLYDKQKQQQIMLADATKSDALDTIIPSGDTNGFTSHNNLLFTKYNSSGTYEFGVDAPPLYIYTSLNQQTKQLIQQSKITVDTDSIIMSPDNTLFVLHSPYTNQGYQIFDTDGKLVKDCYTTNFRYNFYNWGGGPDYGSSLTVWSPDGNYLLSDTSSTPITIADAKTCQIVTTISDNMSVPVWLPQ